MGASLMPAVQSAIDSAVAGGAHYIINEDTAPSFPYACWQKIVSSTATYLEGVPSQTQNNRIQIDVFSNRAADLDPAQAAINTALRAVFGANFIQNSDADLYEPEARLYRRLIDVSIWTNDNA